MKTVKLDKKEMRYLINLMATTRTNLLTDRDLEKKVVKRFQKALRTIKKSSAKGKGRELQKWVCKKISEITGILYNQKDDNSLIRSREMGQKGVDIILREEASCLFPFSVECKSSEQLNLLSTIEQAKNNEKPDTSWMIVYKNKSLQIPVVILSWEIFGGIIHELLLYKTKKTYREGFEKKGIGGYKKIKEDINGKGGNEG